MIIKTGGVVLHWVIAAAVEVGCIEAVGGGKVLLYYRIHYPTRDLQRRQSLLKQGVRSSTNPNRCRKNPRQPGDSILWHSANRAGGRGATQLGPEIPSASTNS